MFVLYLYVYARCKAKVCLRSFCTGFRILCESVRVKAAYKKDSSTYVNAISLLLYSLATKILSLKVVDLRISAIHI